MDYVKIAKINDFKDKHIKSFSIFGKKIGIIQHKDKKFSGIEVSCKHQGADLTAGKIEGTIATCHSTSGNMIWIRENVSPMIPLISENMMSKFEEKISIFLFCLKNSCPLLEQIIYIIEYQM